MCLRQYPVSWVNVRAGNNTVEFYLSKRESDSKYQKVVFSVTPGAYLNVQQLNAEM
jgi:hypothetical protein